jgi:hypothetical protein
VGLEILDLTSLYHQCDHFLAIENIFGIPLISLPHSLTPSLPPSLPPALPPALPPSLPPSQKATVEPARLSLLWKIRVLREAAYNNPSLPPALPPALSFPSGGPTCLTGRLKGAREGGREEGREGGCGKVSRVEWMREGCGGDGYDEHRYAVEEMEDKV